MTTDLVPSVSIEALLQKRDDIAFRVREASRLLSEAMAIAESIEPRMSNPLDVAQRSSRRQHRGLILTRDSDGIIDDVDVELWGWLMERSGMLTFMDAEARTAWRKSLDEGKPPELTRANIEATFTMLHQQRGDFFDRGVVNVFRSLSWDYKSNNPRMFGRKLVLTYVVESTWKGHGGRVTYGGNGDKLDDLLRVFAVCDGHPEPDHRKSARAQINAQIADDMTSTAVVGVLGEKPVPIFEVRCFKNRNAHVRFLRPDLVDKLNAIVAKHHPNALPPAAD